MKTTYCLSTPAPWAKTTLLLIGLLSLFLAGPAALAASLSELLEKGIYSEETKGDLDAAVKLYEQIVAEGKGGQAVAAQAQYRLGVCYYKQKNYTQATAAFEKLAKDYPEQKELVALAREYLAGAVELLPAPWTDGEELRLDLKFPTGFKFGLASYTITAGEKDGHKIWRPASRMYAGVQSFSRVEADAESFKPLHSRWKNTFLGDVDATYSVGYAELKTRGKEEVKRVELEGVVYDNEEAVQLFRRLPLAPGYKTNVRLLAGLGGGQIVPVKLEVTGPEKVEVPAGTFDCYKIELSIRQTFWYSADAHRYLVKFEAGGIVAELNSVNQRKGGEPVKYQDAAFGFSVAAPADWIFFRPEANDDRAKVAIEMLDPEAMASSELFVTAVENLKPEEKKSLRGWADSEVVDGSKVLKDFKVRPESWKERTVGGHPGLSLIGDYVDGQEKQVGYSVFSLGSSNAVNFRLRMAAKDFEAFQPKFEAIIDSYQEKQ